MNQKTTSTSYISIGFCEALGLILIVLKLIGVIDWSWGLILLPIYGPIVIAVLIILIIIIVAIIKNLLEK